MFGGRYSRPVAADDGGETWSHDELLRQPLLRLLTELCLLDHRGPLLVAHLRHGAGGGDGVLHVRPGSDDLPLLESSGAANDMLVIVRANGSELQLPRSLYPLG